METIFKIILGIILFAILPPALLIFAIIIFFAAGMSN